MKKNYLVIGIIVTVIISIILLLVFNRNDVLNIDEKEITTGIFIQTTTRTLIYTESDELFIVNNGTDKNNLYDDCSTGDTVEMEFGLFTLSSDPAQKDAYSCNVISEGDISNISKEVIDLIEEKGFVIE